jgi:hypothetical protein
MCSRLSRYCHVVQSPRSLQGICSNNSLRLLRGPLQYIHARISTKPDVGHSEPLPKKTKHRNACANSDAFVAGSNCHVKNDEWRAEAMRLALVVHAAMQICQTNKNTLRQVHVTLSANAKIRFGKARGEPPLTSNKIRVAQTYYCSCTSSSLQRSARVARTAGGGTATGQRPSSTPPPRAPRPRPSGASPPSSG